MSWYGMKRVLMPQRASTCSNSFTVPPYTSSMETISSPASHAASAAMVSAAIPRRNLLLGCGDGRIAVSRVEVEVTIALGVTAQVVHSRHDEDRCLRDGRSQRSGLAVAFFPRMHTASSVGAFGLGLLHRVSALRADRRL